LTPSDFLSGQNVARSNVERLDDPPAIAVMPAVDSPDIPSRFQQFCFGHLRNSNVFTNSGCNFRVYFSLALNRLAVRTELIKYIRLNSVLPNLRREHMHQPVFVVTETKNYRTASTRFGSP
jgi:hypothetical protein